MKFILLFCTKMRYFLTEAPVLFLFIVSIIYNNRSEQKLKLYPLIIFSAIIIIFIAVYYFQMIKISFSEIRHIGKFSPKESAVINEGKMLVLKLRKRGIVDIELFGNDGKPPIYSDEENYVPVDINLFRGKAVGGVCSVKRILKYFGASIEQAESLVAENCSFECENVNISSQKIEKIREIQIYMKNTI